MINALDSTSTQSNSFSGFDGSHSHSIISADFRDSPTSDQMSVSYGYAEKRPKSDALRRDRPVPENSYMPLGSLRIHSEVDQSATVGGKRSRKSYIIGPKSHRLGFPCPMVDTLVQKGWILANHIYNVRDDNSEAIQVSVLPEDVARRYQMTPSTETRKLLRAIMDYVDRSTAVWMGNFDPLSEIDLLISITTDDESLFYIFNTLESPKCEPAAVSEQHSFEAIHDIMHDDIRGIKARLYPYQKRSAALMVEREVAKRTLRDPRLRTFYGPEGSFYYNKEEGTLIRAPYFYEQPRGGILAETMGYGKTLICLAVIMATRGHYAQIPDGYLEVAGRPRPRAGTLMEMAAANALHHSVPWVTYFQAYAEEGYEFANCKSALDRECRQYIEPQPISREGTRSKQTPRDKIINLSYTTLVIVPPNLLEQWKGEMQKHVRSDHLNWLEISGSTEVITEASELRRYDIVLITKNRFEQEYRDNDQHTGKQGRGEPVFRSPLTDMLWLRAIVDEGHGFAGSSTKTNAMAMLDKMHIER